MSNRCIELEKELKELEKSEEVVKKRRANKYQRECKGVLIDVYDVLKAFNVTNPATAHAIKKLLASGQRGYKDVIQDLEEANASISRAVELER